MPRLLLPSLLTLALTTVGAASGARTHVHDSSPPSDDEPAHDCPLGMLSDDGLCIHVNAGDESREGAPEAESTRNMHRNRSGQWSEYDQIARRPERPADYDAYRYPVPPGLPGGHVVISGYDLDKPDELQRRAATLRQVGHGGIDIPQRKGTLVTLVNLEHQMGDAEVLYEGELFGTTVVTRQTVKEGGQLHDYVVLFGHLDAPAPGIARGRQVRDGEEIGFVGDTGSRELVHLHFEVRRVRDGVDITKVQPSGLISNEVSVVCDPRNVLPLR